jgi:exodeoxyribonuclease VII small subunit
MARRKTNAEEDNAAPSFEDALAGLEAIVEAMEHEQLPLEELVAYYEKGSVLLDRCEALLQSARGRIELITLRNRQVIEPETATRTGEIPDLSLPSGLPDASDADDDDIRLF